MTKSKTISVKLTKKNLADSFLIELGEVYKYLKTHEKLLMELDKSTLEDLLHRQKLFNNNLFKQIGFKPSFKIPIF